MYKHIVVHCSSAFSVTLSVHAVFDPVIQCTQSSNHLLDLAIRYTAFETKVQFFEYPKNNESLLPK